MRSTSALGETVRLLRQRAGLSIQDVATKTGLSNGMISQLERARAMPSIRTLRLLSIALDVPISYFFETSDPAADVQRYIVRKNSRRLLRLTASGVVKEALTPAGQRPARTLRAHAQSRRLVRAPTSCSTPARRPATSSPAACGCGSTTRPIVLEAGDSFRFPSIVPHMFDNPTQQAARVIWVTTLRQTDLPARLKQPSHRYRRKLPLDAAAAEFVAHSGAGLASTGRTRGSAADVVGVRA